MLIIRHCRNIKRLSLVGHRLGNDVLTLINRNLPNLELKYEE